MPHHGRLAISILAALVVVGAARDEPSPEKAAGADRLAMSKAVACSTVKGLEDYVPLPEAKLTSEDKLKVYFRPLGFRAEPYRGRYRARFTEDGRVRRKGEKTILSKEDKLLEFETTFDAPDYQIYLTNTIGLKNLPPGDYEFDIILHDALVEGATAQQTVPFTIIPTPQAEAAPAEVEGPGEPGGSPGPAEKKVAKKARPKRSPRPRG